MHSAVVAVMFSAAAVSAALLVFVSAPYGRHQRGGWGPSIPARLGWVVMESPALLGFLVVFLGGAHRSEVVPIVLACFWTAHYAQRTLIYPILMRPGGTMPASVAVMGLVFNCFNGWMNARWVSHLGQYDLGWLADPRFVVGVVLFVAGAALNLHSDAVLRGLRAPGEKGYSIPYGGGYRWVSCPNYLGELVEWCGWALLTWSTAGLAFAVYTLANLGPRAWTHHRWYIETFEDYPPERRALLPYLF